MTPAVTCITSTATVTALVCSLLLSLSIGSRYWEIMEYKKSTLLQIPGIDRNASYLSAENHFYQVVVTETDEESGNVTSQYYFFRDMYGGIWKLCDMIPESFREGELFQAAMAKAPYLQYACFDYVGEFEARRASFEENGLWIMRMQNSAASCSIVSLLCLLGGVLSGIYGVVQKQVTACMVTAVMYIVSGVFDCFTLIIMHTKVRTLNADCYTLDPMDIPLEASICVDARTVVTGWSIPFAWVAFVMLLIAFLAWALLSRFYRLEKATNLI